MPRPPQSTAATVRTTRSSYRPPAFHGDCMKGRRPPVSAAARERGPFSAAGLVLRCGGHGGGAGACRISPFGPFRLDLVGACWPMHSAVAGDRLPRCWR